MDPYFRVRFCFDPRREIVWQTVCQYLQPRFVGAARCLLDVGAGYCSLINNVTGTEKHALDICPIIEQHAAHDVATHVQSCVDLHTFQAQYFDIVFASNLIEHLSREDANATLTEIYRVLRPGGRFLVLQPNFKHCCKVYFDDYTHTAIFTHHSLADLLRVHGFGIIHIEPRFLPVNMKSRLALRLPCLKLIVWLYLRSPIKPFAGQMLLVAEKPRRSRERPSFTTAGVQTSSMADFIPRWD